MRTNQLQSIARISFIAICITYSLAAFAGDQEKAEKRLRQISAMAIDSIPRSILNQTMADAVHAKRVELMRQRQAMNLSYGSLFLAHQLSANGVKMLDLALELDSGKTIFQIANERNVNWKQIADAAKDLNEKLDDNIYRHYLRQEPEEVDASEKYNREQDQVRADLNITPDELAKARTDYECWKNRGSAPNVKGLNSQKEREADKTAEIYKGGQRPHPVP